MKKIKIINFLEAFVALIFIIVITILLANISMSYIKKEIFTTKLYYFFLTVNEALEGPWAEEGENIEIPRANYTYEQNVKWLEKYILDNMQYTSIKNSYDTNKSKKNAVCVQLLNGTAFEFAVDNDNGPDVFYFPDGECLNTNGDNELTSKNIFAFQLSVNLKPTANIKLYEEDFIEPYIYKWNGTKSDLYNNPEYGCKKGKKKFYCTRIIKDNHWSIPAEYPW